MDKRLSAAYQEAIDLHIEHGNLSGPIEDAVQRDLALWMHIANDQLDDVYRQHRDAVFEVMAMEPTRGEDRTVWFTLLSAVQRDTRMLRRFCATLGVECFC